MEKIGEESGSALGDQEQTNRRESVYLLVQRYLRDLPTNPPKSLFLPIQRYLTDLFRAIQCKDGNRVPCCMKRVVQHIKMCKQKNSGCPICKRLVTICSYHAKWCQEAVCPVPFCAYIKTRLRQQQLQRRLQQEHTLERRFAAMQIRRMSHAILQPFPGITTSVKENEPGTESEEDEKTKEPEVRGLEKLAANPKQLFLNGQNSDAALEVHGRKFQVHKAILAARSPVFASMFQHDTIEKKSGVVDIPDCTAESFEAFLLYLYTGSADSISVNNVFNLYYAADKYRVDDLKEECVEYMINILSVETFCDIIALSLRHGECKLQKEATRFFRENIKKIIKTVQWQKYFIDYTTHANELFIKALA